MNPNRTPFPEYRSLTAGNSYTVPRNNTVAVILSADATATWAMENGSTGNISISMAFGRYAQAITITAVGGPVELIVNGNVQLTGSGSDAQNTQEDVLHELELILEKLDQGRLNVDLEDFAVVMRNIMVQALGRNNLTHSGPNGNAQRVIFVNSNGSVVGDNLNNITMLGNYSVREALYSPTDRILWAQSVRNKII